MKKIIPAFIAALALCGCKKEAAVQQQPNTVTTNVSSGGLKTLSSTPASALKGVNWACSADNFSDTILVLSGLTSADSYSTVTAKTNSLLTSLVTNTGANTIRIPVNYATTSQSWWNSYTAVIDAATAKGLNVIIGCWEGSSSKDGKIDNTTQFWSMWQTVVNKYGSSTKLNLIVIRFGISCDGTRALRILMNRCM